MTGRKRRILVIDDDIAHLDSTRGILEDAGYEVITHLRAFGASNMLRDTRPDLVLLDVNMPGLSGENLLQIFRANNATKDARVVLYSSNDEDTLRGSVARLGANGYICKGDPLMLRRRVQQYLS